MVARATDPWSPTLSSASVEIPSKPLLMHWLAALLSLAAGAVNEWTVRLPSATFACAGILLCYLYVRRLFDQRAALIAHTRIRICATDESIFVMGSPGDSMAVVLSGRVRISAASPDGKEVVRRSAERYPSALWALAVAALVPVHHPRVTRRAGDARRQGAPGLQGAK